LIVSSGIPGMPSLDSGNEGKRGIKNYPFGVGDPFSSDSPNNPFGSGW
jgi:hypothetical protein